ncbi:MAG: hypothetical protein ACREJC_12265 [Tepidisphaeraceae bacterium]
MSLTACFISALLAGGDRPVSAAPSSAPTTVPTVELFSRDFGDTRVIVVRANEDYENRLVVPNDRYSRLAMPSYSVQLVTKDGAVRFLWRWPVAVISGREVGRLDPEILDVQWDGKTLVLVFNQYYGCWARVMVIGDDGTVTVTPATSIVAAPGYGDVGSRGASARIVGTLGENNLSVAVQDSEGMTRRYSLRSSGETLIWKLEK